MDIKDIKVGQRWILKSKEACEACHACFCDEMIPFCGKEQEVETIAEPRQTNAGDLFYIKGCPFFWTSECLNHIVSDVPDTMPEDSPINPTPENTAPRETSPAARTLINCFSRNRSLAFTMFVLEKYRYALLLIMCRRGIALSQRRKTENSCLIPRNRAIPINGAMFLTRFTEQC